MRLISQNGEIDVSYENGSLVIGVCKNEDIKSARIYYHDSSSQRGTRLAEYSSKSKAIKAMEMLHEAYVGKLVCQNIRMTKDVEEILKSWNTQAIIGETAHNEPNIDYINNTIFQFPKDENVEVDS